MGKCLHVLNPLHRSTKRGYLGRMNDDKVHCMDVARQFGQAFWDGDRRYGYGGYRYDGRWKPVAHQLIDIYNLPQKARILDVGCGKGYLLYEFKQLLPDCTIVGLDISTYALENAKAEVKPHLFLHEAQQPFPFDDNQFDLVVSLTTLHNLALQDLHNTLKQIQRVGRRAYIVVESFRSNLELFNLQCWALTCESFFRPETWQFVFETAGYEGDYEFIFFE